MSATDLFGIACWPLVVLGLFATIATYRKIGFRSPLGQWILSAMLILTIAPPLILVMFFNNWSAAMVADQYIGAILVGALLITIPWSPMAQASIDKTFGGIFGSIAKAFMPILGAAMVIFSSSFLIGDFVLLRDYVDGVVSDKQMQNDRLGPTYRIYLNNQPHLTTGELYQRVRIGQHGRAEIGASRMMFGFEPLY